MRGVLLALIAGTVLSGLAAAWAASVHKGAADAVVSLPPPAIARVD